MLREMLRQLGRVTLRMVKRFLANTPSNKYEETVFRAIREVAFNFGKAYA